MRDVLDALCALAARESVALARVVVVRGSAPRPVGSALVVRATGEVVGSLSTGCVEAAVIASAADVIATGRAAIERFGTDPDPLAPGLTCGGEIEVLIERVDVDAAAAFADLARRVAADEACALLTTVGTDTRRMVMTAGAEASAEGTTPWDRVSSDARAMAAAGRSGVIGADDCGDAVAGDRAAVFVHVFARSPRMILAGANDFVRALADVARLLGYRVTVVDARATFTAPARFPGAHVVVVDRPDRYLYAEHAAGRLDRRTVVCVMTHDDKFDVPALLAALTVDRLAFVGAMGSRRTHADRVRRLLDEGLPAEDLARLHSPVGLDIDAHTAEETAVSIAAAIIADRTGASAAPLADRDGPIHL